MMQKLIANKKIVICACAAAAVAIVTVIALLMNREETFRSIMVYDVEGSAVIERENVGAMDAAENLYLESGDRVSVATDSSMRMKLDDDKYVMAEADTVFAVEAAGTDADSETKISLEQGAITNEIQHPLSEGSRYETSTPNSVMAVRGTIYRVELYVDENGEQNTKLCCFQGKVGTTPILSDGAYGEEIMVPAGSELIVYQDGTTGDVKDIAYDELPVQAVENLLGMMENGQDVTGISEDALSKLASETESADEATANEAEQSAAEETLTAEAAAKTDAESEADQETDAQIDTDSKTAKNTPARGAGEKPKVPAVQTKPEQPAPTPKAPEIKPPKTAEPSNGGDTGNGEEGSQDENGGDNADEDKSDDDKKDKKKPSKPKTYTVTFMYQGEVFATQSVKSGEKAAAPVLVPAQSGAWDFDFATKIKANTTISWK